MSEHINEQPDQPDEANERDDESVEQPRIWVGSLADYNNGRLHGEWIDAAVPADYLAAAVQAMLNDSAEPGAEEYGIFDYDGFGNFRVHEYARLESVARVARGIAEFGPPFAAWAQLHDGDPTMLDQFEESFMGEWDSASAWAHEELMDGWLRDALDTVVPEAFRRYVIVDCQQFARDAELGGDIYVEKNPDGGVWIYRAL